MTHKLSRMAITGMLFVLACRAAPKPTDSEPGSARAALVVTSDYESGAYSVVDLGSLDVHRDIAAIHPDAVCRVDRTLRRPFLIERHGADAVDVLAPAEGWRVTSQYSVGAGTNPQDIAAVSPDRAYVARLGHPGLLVVNPLTGAEIDTVDLTDYADDDGVADITWLYALEGKVYALAARLEAFRPTGSSAMLVIDGETGAVEEEIPLSHTNPSGKLRYNGALERFVLIETGGFSSLGGAGEMDGIVETFDPETRTVSGAVITAEALGGDIIDAVLVSETRGVAIIEHGSDDTLATRLVAFDPSTGEKGQTLRESDAWAFSALELTPDGGAIWLADRTRTRPGIRIFDTDTLQMMTEEPIDVGLPPFMICFGDAVGKAVPDAGVPDEDNTDRDTGTETPAEETLEMGVTPEEMPPLGETACPVPSAPALTVITPETQLEWTVPADAGVTIQIGATRDLDREAPEEWLDERIYGFDEAPPYAVKLFARAIGDGCDTTHVFSHIYNVRETFPPPPGAPGSTAVAMDAPDLAGWADGWVEPVAYGEEVDEQWRTPERATGPAVGGAFDVVSLGRGGEITLTFDAPLADRRGFDFAVFENGTSDGFLDLAFVAVSSDGETFVRFDSAYLGDTPVDRFGTFDTRVVGGLAGKYRQGFGHPFDLYALANAPEVLSGVVDLLHIRYVKLVDVIGDGRLEDSFGHPIYDPFPTYESAGFDLDAVGGIVNRSDR